MLSDFERNCADFSVGQRLRQLRIARRLDAGEVAGWLDLPEAALLEAEEGWRRIRARELFVLAGRLRVPVRAFFGEPGDDGPGGGERLPA